MNKSDMTAVVTGASRGLGRAAAEDLARKGYSVIMAMRNHEKKDGEIKLLQKEGLKVSSAELDVSDPEGIKKFITYVDKTYGRCDILINNAGIFNDDRKTSGSPLKTDIDTIKESLEVNTFGPLRLIQGIVQVMKKNGFGRIVNVSSGMGSFDEMDRGYISYRISKTALNVITKLTAPELAGTDILINSVCPGWVKTDMGGPGAERTVEEGISGIIWAATLPEGGPSGGFFRDGKRIKW